MRERGLKSVLVIGGLTPGLVGYAVADPGIGLLLAPVAVRRAVVVSPDGFGEIKDVIHALVRALVMNRQETPVLVVSETPERYASLKNAGAASVVTPDALLALLLALRPKLKHLPLPRPRLQLCG